MSRQAARESAMKLLFESEFNIDFETETTLELMAPLELSPNDRIFIDVAKDGTLLHLDEIDAIIERHAKGWSLERISTVDKSILRLAIYEIIFGDTPEAIAISEAVNMARTFSSDEASSFVNGILGSVSRERAQSE